MRGSMLERYRMSLPLSAETPLVSLGEGNTPLVRADRISERLGLDVWLKWEGANPTGSFKDRGMAVAVSKALESGAPGVVCASTGNTAASAAAYAARAGIEAVVVHAAGAVAAGKLVQVRAAGARLVPVDGSFDDAFAAAIELAEREGYTFVNSTNPHRLEGQKTAAFEIVEQLGGTPDVLALPYGGGGNTAAYFKGFGELGEPLPRLVPGAGGGAPRDGRLGDPDRRAGARPRGRAGGRAPRAARSSPWTTRRSSPRGGRSPARKASSASRPRRPLSPASSRRVEAGARVVCVLTGHGLKDTASFDELAG